MHEHCQECMMGLARLRDIENGLRNQIEGIDARTKGLAPVFTSANVTNGGAGNGGKLFALDDDGKAAGRVLEVDGPALDALRGSVASGSRTLSEYGGPVFLNFGPSTFTVPTAAAPGTQWLIHAHGVQITISREGGGSHLSWGGQLAASWVLASNLYQVIRVVVVSSTNIRITATLFRTGEVTGPPATRTSLPFVPFELVSGLATTGFITLTGARAGSTVLGAMQYDADGGLVAFDARLNFEGTLQNDGQIEQIVGVDLSTYRFGFILGN